MSTLSNEHRGAEVLIGTALNEYVSLKLEGAGPPETRASSGPLVIQLEDGKTVTLDLSSTRFMPNVDERARFGELLDRGLASRFLDRAPADHVRVRIHGTHVPPGMRVAARGSIVEWEASGSAGYRTVVQRPVSMKVEVLACGDEAERALGGTAEIALGSVREPRGRRVSLLPAALLGVLALLLAALTALLLREGAEKTLAAGTLAACAGSLALYIFALRRAPPALRAAYGDLHGATRPSLAQLIVGILVGTLFLICYPIVVLLPPERAVPWASFVIAAMALPSLLSLRFRHRGTLRRLWHFVLAPRATGDGRAGALEGRVVRGSVRRTRDFTRLIEHYRREFGANGGRLRDLRGSLEQKPLEVQLGDGSKLSVEAGGGAFAADEIWIQRDEYVEEIAVGDHVRVVGRPVLDENGAWSVRSTGPDSLFVLGSRKGRARSAAARALIVHGLIWLTLASFAGLPVALSFVV